VNRSREAGREARSADGTEGTKGNHYSYAVYADPAMAERFEGMRFGGPIGQLVAETQARQILAFLSPIEGRRVLDVGTGTGRAAIALAKAGAIATGIDASREMLAVAERRAREEQARVTFAVGDAHHIEFPDRSFDAVICLRVLMHTPDWKASLRELCRVAADRVVFDYPSLYSVAALQAAVRRVTHRVNPAVEAYRVFAPSAVARVLADAGFRVTGEHRQFVLPIALHKRINSVRWTTSVEGALHRAGLMRMFGSPITVVASRAA
jgi:SAM-dependent methyltransferase